MRIGFARDLQRTTLEDAGCDKMFQDTGVSVAARVRPGLSLALDEVGEGDVLVVWKLDRLGRSLSHLVELLDNLRKRGVGFDTTTAGGRLDFHMMAALSEFERPIIVERTKAGTSAAKRHGKRLGRPVKLTPDHLDHARALLASGEHTRRWVAKLLGVNESTLRRAMKGE